MKNATEWRESWTTRQAIRDGGGNASTVPPAAVPSGTISRSVGTILSLILSLLVLAVIAPAESHAARPFSSKIGPLPSSAFGVVTGRRSLPRLSIALSRPVSARRSKNGRVLGRTLTDHRRLKMLWHDDVWRGGSTEVDDEEAMDGETGTQDEGGAGGGTSSGANENMDDGTANDEEEEEDDEEEHDNKDGPEKEDTEPTIVDDRVTVVIQTNWGSPILDQNLEIQARRMRNIAKIKESVSKQMPGKPPVLGLEIVYEGRVLDDDVVLDELFQDDDDEEEEEESTKTFVLNVIPPIDPRFATELIPKIRPHSEDDDSTSTTEDLLDAYFLNQAAMARNAQLLANPNASGSLPSTLLRLEMKEQAEAMKQQLQQETPADVWENALTPVPKHTEERRGNRYRSGRGGATTNLRRSLQTNLNLDWGTAIWNFLLFLFFGFFGTSRGSLSRFLLLWAAPLSIGMQARPIKMWIKVVFYSMSKPPAFVLSLLSAPQQAIMSFDAEESYKALYGTNISAAGGGRAIGRKENVETSRLMDPTEEDENELDEEDDNEESYDEEEDED